MGAVQFVDGLGRKHWQPELDSGERLYESEQASRELGRRVEWWLGPEHRRRPSAEIRPSLWPFRWMAASIAWAEERKRHKRAVKADWERLRWTLTEIQRGR